MSVNSSTATTANNYSSPLALSGLSTGLDTSTIIQELMSIQKQPENLIAAQQTKAQNQLAAYQSINTQLMALQTSATTLMGLDQNISPFSNMSATSSNTGAFTAAINGTASPGTYNVTVNNLATTQSYAGGTFTGGQAGSFTITQGANTATITVSASDTAQTIANQINSNVNSGMNATVIGGNLVMGGKNSGAAGNSTVTGSAALMNSIFGASPNNVAGTDASISINGISETSSSNTFTAALSGVDLTVTGAGSGTVTMANDYSSVVNDMKDLVSKFNAVITSINQATAYDPTSKTGGPLLGDSTIENLASQLTAQITGEFDSTPHNSTGNPGLRNYTDVGLSVQKDGTMTLDSTKLTAALTTYSQATPGSASAYQLFSNEDGLTMADGTKLNDVGVAGNNGNAANFGDGIANRLNAFIDQMITPSSAWNTTIPSAGGSRYNGALLDHISTLNAQITDYGNQITAYDSRLAQYQEYLTNQFNAMETNVANIRNQGSFLTGASSSTTSSSTTG